MNIVDQQYNRFNGKNLVNFDNLFSVSEALGCNSFCKNYFVFALFCKTVAGAFLLLVRFFMLKSGS